MKWLVIDTALLFLFAAQHSLLTTVPAVVLIERITAKTLWNFVFSVLSIFTVLVIWLLWEPSGITIYRLERPYFEAMLAAHAFFIFMFFYCFKYTSFWKWLGIAQLYRVLRGIPPDHYYRINKTGLKKYIRFPHHTFLILVFWAQPVMTADTMWLAIVATVYTWVGTVHQDSRGRRILGDAWVEYSQYTHILVPPFWRSKKALSPKAING